VPRLGRSRPQGAYGRPRPVEFFAPAQIAQPDAAGAVDSVSVAAAIPMADVAGAVETLKIVIQQSDVAGAIEAMSVAVQQPVAEVAGAVEAMSFPVPIPTPQHEVAAGLDSMAVQKSGPPTLSGTLPAIVLTQGLPAGYQGGPSGGASVPPSALGNGWEILVRSASDYTTLLAVIPGSMLMGFQFWWVGETSCRSPTRVAVMEPSTVEV